MMQPLLRHSSATTPCSHNGFFSGIPLFHHHLALLLPPPCPQYCGASPFTIMARKGKRRYAPGMPQPRPAPSFPKFDDDDNPKFVIFARNKQVPLWSPLSIVSGGSTAKMMVAARGIELGKKISESALTRNIGAAVYKDEKAIRVTISKRYAILKTAKDIEYGYKIVEKDNPAAALTTSNIIKIPPKEELKSVVDKVKDFFGQGMSGFKDSFGSITSLDFRPEEQTSASPAVKDSKSK